MIRLRWFNFDVSRDRKNNPITVVDRILEIAAGMMAVGMLVLTSVLYVQAPDTVPSHFNVMGEANGWSDKSIYWIMAAVFVVSMIISASAAYNRKLVNLPVRLKEAVFYRQIGLIGRMCRILTLALGCIWLAVVLSMSSSFLGIPSWGCAVMFAVSLALILGTAFFYTLKIWWIGRNCH